MAEFVLNPGQGVAFGNDRKSSERQPDYKGRLKLDADMKAGDELKFAIWSKNGARGVWLSLKIDNPLVNGSRPYEPKKTYKSKSLDDEIPF